MKVADLYASLGIRPDRASLSKADAFLGRAKTRVRRFSLAARAMLGKALTFAGIGGGAAGILGLGIAAKDAFAFERELTRLEIASRGALGSFAHVRQSILGISKDTGVAKEEVLNAGRAFVSLTGRGGDAIDMMKVFSRVSVASGASMDDIAASAAAMVQNLNIPKDQVEHAFDVLISGGKSGAVELRDLAGLMAELTPLAQQFAGGQGVKGLADMAAALQMVRQGAGTAPQAATQLQGLMVAVQKNATRFKKYGVEVFDASGNLKNFQEIIKAIGESDLVNDKTKLIKAFGRVEAYKAFIQLQKNEQQWKDLSAATMEARDVQEDYDKFQASSAGRAEKSWNSLKVAIAEAFTPERVKALAGAIESVLEYAAKLVRFIERTAEAAAKIVVQAEKTGARFEQLQDEGRTFGESAMIVITERQDERLRANKEAFEQLNRSFGRVAPGEQPRGSAGTVNQNVENNITVHAAPGDDGFAIGKKVSFEVNKSLELERRKLEAVTNE